MANQNLTSPFCVRVESDNGDDLYVRSGRDELASMGVDIFHRDLKLFHIECSVEDGMLETRIYDDQGDLMTTRQSDLKE